MKIVHLLLIELYIFLYLLSFVSESDSHYLAAELVKWLDIHGPCVTVDTGGSSSLAAIDMALYDLEDGSIDYAIVTGKQANRSIYNCWASLAV